MDRIRLESGTSLVEILVALWVISIGLLGLAALNTRVIQAKLESYQRVEALLLLDNIANIIQTNPECLEDHALMDQCLPQRPTLPGLNICIVQESASRINLSVAWQGIFETVAPHNPCGADLLGTDQQRRRVITTVASHASE